MIKPALTVISRAWRAMDPLINNALLALKIGTFLIQRARNNALLKPGLTLHLNAHPVIQSALLALDLLKTSAKNAIIQLSFSLTSVWTNARKDFMKILILLSAKNVTGNAKNALELVKLNAKLVNFRILCKKTFVNLNVTLVTIGTLNKEFV